MSEVTLDEHAIASRPGAEADATTALDPEIVAIGAVSKALAPLDEAQRSRVVRWAADRFGVSLRVSDSSKAGAPIGIDGDGGGGESADNGRAGGGPPSWEHFAELYDATGPATDAERVLVAAYWFQFVEGTHPFFSIPLNKLLKDLGHGVADVARATNALTEQKPALLLQLKKSGKSRQARKTFKVTDAGRKVVEQMISADGA